VLEALGEGALVPSRTSEHARLVTGMAGELERSLRDVEGVLAARVHLAVPPKDALGIGDTPEAPTASVLLRHRGATPPMTQSDIQRLVAGAVPGLSAEEVSVVTTPVPEALTRRERPLAHFGPITVARTSLTSLRIAVAIVVTVLLGLLAAVVGAWLRLRRVQLALDEARAGASAPDPAS
jgi:type III secretion protein J